MRSVPSALLIARRSQSDSRRWKILTLRPLQPSDVQTIVAAFAAIGWNKTPANQYERYLEEQDLGERAVLVAFWHEEFAGYLTICWQSSYPPFMDEGIPEIVT